MKILLINNFYKSKYPSGENSLFKAESKLLSNKKNNLKIFTKNSDTIIKKNKNLFFVGLNYIWNFKVQFEINNLLKKFKPNLIHVHNTFPLISYSVLHLKKKIPIFLTLHNLRIFCASGDLLRNNRVCTICIKQKSILPALKFKCYENNFFKTLPIAINIFILRFFKILNKKNINIFAFSKFQKKLLIKGGLNKNKIFIKKNFVENNFKHINFSSKKDYVTFSGRLSVEKGVDKLIKCWNIWGVDAPNLKIIGNGPLFEELKNKNSNSKIQFLGLLDRIKTMQIIAYSKMIIFPTQCYEGMPMTILEAFSVKTPVIASNLGPISEIISHNQNGVLFKHNNLKSMMSSIKQNWQNKKKLALISEKAFLKYEKIYSARANYENLLSLYNNQIKKY